MKILSRNGLVIVIATLILPLTVLAGSNELFPPADYIHSKLQAERYRIPGNNAQEARDSWLHR